MKKSVLVMTIIATILTVCSAVFGFFGALILKQTIMGVAAGEIFDFASVLKSIFTFSDISITSIISLSFLGLIVVLLLIQIIVICKKKTFANFFTSAIWLVDGLVSFLFIPLFGTAFKTFVDSNFATIPGTMDIIGLLLVFVAFVISLISLIMSMKGSKPVVVAPESEGITSTAKDEKSVNFDASEEEQNVEVVHATKEKPIIEVALVEQEKDDDVQIVNSQVVAKPEEKPVEQKENNVETPVVETKPVENAPVEEKSSQKKVSVKPASTAKKDYNFQKNPNVKRSKAAAPVKKTKKAEVKPVVEDKTINTTNAEKTVKTPAKNAVSTDATTKKATAPIKVYHLNKRADDNKWTIKFNGGSKVIKLFNTKEEAVVYANNLAKNQGGTVLVHASKGEKKGKIIKQ
jgi:hypothetical protein